MTSCRIQSGAMARVARRLAAALAVWALAVAVGRAEDLRVVYSDGQSEEIPVVQYEGVEHITLQSLGKILKRVDAGATLLHEYNPNSLRLMVAGKNVSIKETYTVVEGAISRPRHPLQVVNGEFLIPVDSLEDINSSLGLFQLNLMPENPQPTPEETPIVPPEEPVPGEETPPPALEPTPEPGFTPPESGFSPEPATVDSLLFSVPDHVRELATTDLADLLRAAPLPSIDSVALVPQGADPTVQGSYASVIQTVSSEVAARTKTLLEGSGRFAARVPNTPATPKTLAQTVEWVNNSQCDTMVALTVDISPNHNLSGMRIWTAHEAGDAAARPVEKGGAYGLPALFNYIPYQNYSLLLASLIHNELNRTDDLRSHSVEISPSYLLRRVAMPGVMVSLGYASTDKERERMSTGQFVEEASKALADALERMQDMNREGGHGG